MLKISRLFVTVLILSSAAVFPSAVSAQTSDSFCHTFKTRLSITMSGPGVTALQTALTLNGETVPITGYFGRKTAAAVTVFQERYASEILTPQGLDHGTGFVGASTRIKLNGLYGCIEQPISSAQTTDNALNTNTPNGSGTGNTSQVSTATASASSGTLNYVVGQNNEHRIDQADVQFLLEVAVGLHTCPEHRICDLNKDGKVSASDALVLAKYVGDASVGGQYDYDNNARIDSSDVTILSRVGVGLATCPSGKVCDISRDDQASTYDATLLQSYIGSN
jgi:hypothetical protein